jgi:hypothetical protein
VTWEATVVFDRTTAKRAPAARVARSVDVRDRLAGSVGGGHPLDPETRAVMEPHFAHSFADVRVHADETAAALCEDVSARAFTYGRDVYFGARSFDPRGAAGRRLIAHELRHVVQPRSADGAELHGYRVADITVRRATPDEDVVVNPAFELPQPLNLPLLLSEQRDLVVDYILPQLFLEISKREVETREPEGNLKYEEGNKLTIELSGKTSAVAYHCTDLVMNSAFLAGYEVLSGGTGFYLPAEKTRQRVLAKRPGDVVEPVPVPEDLPDTPQDESKSSLRPGDVMVWGPRTQLNEAYGHTMIIVETGDKAGVVTVREAGTGVHERRERPLLPAGRQSAVYRFTTPNLERIQRNYDTDADYRRMFEAAFEWNFRHPGRGPRADDPGRYRIVSQP